MSNQAVGTVYQTIIDEVINSSRVDFEESGVEENVLEELRQMICFGAVAARMHHGRRTAASPLREPCTPTEAINPDSVVVQDFSDGIAKPGVLQQSECDCASMAAVAAGRMAVTLGTKKRARGGGQPSAIWAF
ncbi:hypothetical protein E5D57_007010 [Metarhizium anisopliae]|nr:hypothetical protein E5D57_007010 [Metarhizium anisopliae]